MLFYEHQAVTLSVLIKSENHSFLTDVVNLPDAVIKLQFQTRYKHGTNMVQTCMYKCNNDFRTILCVCVKVMIDIILCEVFVYVRSRRERGGGVGEADRHCCRNSHRDA